MNKSSIFCISLMGALLASACGEHQVDFKCEVGESYCKSADSVCYICKEDEVSQSTYWESKVCKAGIDEQNKKCKDCDFGYNSDGSCIQPKNCKTGWDVKESKCACSDLCVYGCNDDGSCKNAFKCTDTTDNLCEDIDCKNGWNNDGSCTCVSLCKYGCEEDGSCKRTKECKSQNWIEDGSCSCNDNCLKDENGDLLCNPDGSCKGCYNGWNEDGSCACPEDCGEVGCNSLSGACNCKEDCVEGSECNVYDGTCKPLQGCINNLWNADGSCGCPEQCNEKNGGAGCENNGACKCKENCVEGSECNSVDGTCSCASDCLTACHENGLCKSAGSCTKDDDCKEHNYCTSNNPCYCRLIDDNSDKLQYHCYLKDYNYNHMIDLNNEDLLWNSIECKTTLDCKKEAQTNKELTFNENLTFCDSFIGYKCSTKCSNDTQCLDGFSCRSDGRCAPDSFTTIWASSLREHTLIIGTDSNKCNACICWDWKEDGICSSGSSDSLNGCESGFEHFDCSKLIFHDYSKDSKQSSDSNITVKVRGELNQFHLVDCDRRIESDNYKDPCDSNNASNYDYRKDLIEIQSFGPVGLGAGHLIGTDPDDNGDIYSSGVFEECTGLKTLSSIDIPNSKELVSMDRMFTRTCQFNFPIENWDVSNVTSMNKLFWGCCGSNTPDCAKFNQPLNNWDVSNVITMSNMFTGCTDFNQPLKDWDVSKVTDMTGMFAITTFNQPIDTWNVSQVTSMEEMFADNYAFNQNLEKWKNKVSQVKKMQKMFLYAKNFVDFSGKGNKNTGLADWNISSNTDITNIFVNAGLHFQYAWFDNKENSEICKIYKAWKNKVNFEYGENKSNPICSWIANACECLSESACDNVDTFKVISDTYSFEHYCE